MSANRYLYAMNGRVLWIGSRLSQVPVLSELYTAHLFKGHLAEPCDITDFIIESTHRLIVTEAKLSPLSDAGLKAKAVLSSKKVEAFLILCENIEISYRLTLPQVFYSENDNVEILAFSLLEKNLDDDAQQKHLNFINESHIEKKKELKIRYLEGVKKIREAKSVTSLNEIYHAIGLSQVHV